MHQLPAHLQVSLCHMRRGDASKEASSLFLRASREAECASESLIKPFLVSFSLTPFVSLLLIAYSLTARITTIMKHWPSSCAPCAATCVLTVIDSCICIAGPNLIRDR